MPAEHFEFAVVGGGKGGKTLAAKMASAGRQVVMVEKGMIGGTCINVACIPTKTMVRSAKVAELARRAAGFGIRVAFDRTDAVGLRDRKRRVVAEMIGRNQANFDRSGMTLLIGTARFTGPRTLEVRLREGGTRHLTGDKVFLNTGTRPALPPLPGLADARPLSSESVQELDRLPEHLIVIPGVLKNAIDHASRPYGQSVWGGKPAGVIGVSVGAIGTAITQQHLRSVLAYLDVPTLGQPECFIQMKEGLFDSSGNIGPDSRQFLQGWMDRYVTWIKVHGG